MHTFVQWFCNYKACCMSYTNGEKTARHFPGYLIPGAPPGHSCDQTHRTVTSAGLNSLTMKTIPRSQAPPQLFKQLEEIKQRGWNTFYTSNDNGQSCLPVVFFFFFVFSQKTGIFIIAPLPNPIFHFAAPSAPLWLPLSKKKKTSMRILNLQQASSVSQHGLEIHIKPECFWSETEQKH